MIAMVTNYRFRATNASMPSNDDIQFVAMVTNEWWLLAD
jgi:hypothetical protein